MDEYVIHVTKTGYPGFDGTWGVGFSKAKTGSGKEVTFCLLRNELWFEPLSGCSIRNPKDHYDPLRGEQVAFKRAVENLCNLCYMKETETKPVVTRFRGALWIAMGKPGYKKMENIAQTPNTPQNVGDYWVKLPDYEGE